jgi:hypothetical protein
VSGPVVGAGMGLSFNRLSTALKRLEAAWEFASGEGSLDEAAAFAAIQRKDVRPVLLLRDCIHSERDSTKVSTFTQDERVALAMRWFHCVRVDRDVVKATHPLHALFAGASPPHMVLLTGNGKERVDLPLMPSAAALWSSMLKVLKKEYVKPADEAVARWRALLSRFDSLDSRKAKLAGEAYRNSDPEKREAIEAQIEQIEAEKSKVAAEEKRIADLEHRDPQAAAVAAKAAATDETWRDGLLRGRSPAEAPPQPPKN